MACSADLADSTNIAGFAQGLRRLARAAAGTSATRTRDGALLPQEITEFTNSGITAGIATVNFAADPFEEFNGFWGACSTYGSFSYLKYGPMRLFSQLAQDSQLKVGKVLWVAGHSGPETAEDSRTHFGIFEPGVTQLFPDGHVIDLHPWEHNEVPVLLAAALATDAPIVALHLTRPRGRDPRPRGARHAVALRGGARRLRHAPYKRGQPNGGTIFVQGTSTTANVVKLLPELDEAGPERQDRRGLSPQLFALQDEALPRSRSRRWATAGTRWPSPTARGARCTTGSAARSRASTR